MHIYNSTRQIGVLAVAREGPSPTIGSHITIGLNKIAGLAWVDPVHPVAGGASGLEDLGAVAEDVSWRCHSANLRNKWVCVLGSRVCVVPVAVDNGSGDWS